MDQSTIQSDSQIIKLCARLAKFAYTSGNPESELSSRADNDRVAKTALLKELKFRNTALESVIDFQRYYSHSWFIPKPLQPRWFRSYAYFCHIQGEAVDLIIVGFRGTWNDTAGSGKWFDESAALQQSCVSRFFTWVTKKLTPSSKYGFSDFYYDATVIRIPYWEGTVWKWYAYWGSLILERTRFAPEFFVYPRTVAQDWMTRANSQKNSLGGGRVHLGFWSLWASPEGFAGYCRKGDILRETGVMNSIRGALKKSEGRKTEVYVVGHSLGGAVSSFAALDIAKELREHPNATMYHVTFGSPPVGTVAFAAYFKSQVYAKKSELNRHHSWSISHKQDLIPKCFSWCASQPYLGLLHWWSDWSCIGKRRLITRARTQEPSVATDESDGIGIIEKFKLGIAGLGALAILYGSSLLAIPTSGAWYFLNWCYYKRKETPPKTSEYPYDNITHSLVENVENVGLEYHSLQRYIDLMETENDLEKLWSSEP